MAHIWTLNSNGWEAVPLGGEAVALAGDGAESAFTSDGDDVGTGGEGDGRVVLLRHQDRDQETCVLVVSADAAVCVNGQPLRLGVCVLKDKDEIRLGGGDRRLFFSTECPARVEAMAGTASQVVCPRCKQAIAEESPVVRCPRCGIVHHQAGELPCWTGHPDRPFDTCSMCDQPATLGDGFQWTPEDI